MRLLAISLKQQADVFLSHGNFDSAIALLPEAKEICQTAHDFRLLEDVLRQLSHAADSVSNYELAERCYEQLTVVARQLSHPKLQAISLYHRARLSFPQRKYEQAMVALEEGKAICITHKLDLELSEIIQGIGIAYEGIGDFEKALLNYEKAELLCQRTKNYFGLASSVVHRASLLRAGGAPAEIVRPMVEFCWNLVRHHRLIAIESYLQDEFPDIR